MYNGGKYNSPKGDTRVQGVWIDRWRKEGDNRAGHVLPRIQLAVVVGAAVPPELDFAGRC